jgi:hypothetical protein
VGNEVDPIREHPAFRELMDQLAVQMEHLDLALAPRGEYTTRIDLLRAQLERMLSQGTEHRDWIVTFLDRLHKHDVMRAPLERLDQLERERRGGY